MGNYMQEQRSILLENVRAKYRATDEYIQVNRHQSLQKRFSGEINELMLEADKHLQEAEYLLPALANRSTQKIALIGFNNSLRLANQCRLRAIIEPIAGYGREQLALRRKGADNTNSKRSNPEVSELIKALARQKDALDDPVKPKQLWPQLFSDMDELQLRPREKGKGTDKRYDHDGGCIKYKAFCQQLRRVRKVQHA